jgi:hypothetical protein
MDTWVIDFIGVGIGMVLLGLAWYFAKIAR